MLYHSEFIYYTVIFLKSQYSFFIKISALFETSCFKKGSKHRSLHRPPEQMDSNLGDYWNQPFGIYGIIGKFSSKKSPKTLDTVGIQPTVSSVLIICPVLIKKMQHPRVFQRSSQAAKPQKAGSDQSRGECACKRTGGGSAALCREGGAKQTLLQRGRSVIKGSVKIQ